MPICPQCKYEYVEGIALCSDCEVPLVQNLSELEAQAQNNQASALAELVVVFKSSSPMELSMIKSFLEASNIEVFANGSRFAQVFVNMEGLGEVYLQVSLAQAEQAREIIADLHAMGENPPAQEPEFK
jgi:hypothetical protein